MKTLCDLLSNNVCFKDIPKDIIYSVLNSRACFIKKVSEEIGMFENNTDNRLLGIVSRGSADIICISDNGDENIVNRFVKGMDFWCSNFNIVTNASTYIRSPCHSEILFINIDELIMECFVNEHRELLLRNIIASLTEHNILLYTKVHIMSQRTLRGKLLAYMEFLCHVNKTSEITIPFNREQLAYFLNSERSSVCRELSKLESDKIIKLNKNNVVFMTKATQH